MDASVRQLESRLNDERANLERLSREVPMGSREVPPPSDAEIRGFQLDSAIASVDRQLSALERYGRGEQ